MAEREFDRLYEQEMKENIKLPDGYKDRYEVLACLKDTLEKKTFLLKEKVTGEKYILKYAGGEEAPHLLEEGKILRELGKIQESDICVKEMIREKEAAYLLRNYIEGNSLAEIGEVRSFSQEEICRIGILLCQCVVKLHQRKPPVIHRDIKPENIILKKDESLSLIDLETARSYKEGKSEDTYFAGTRETAAPEQYGFGQSDERTDIYGIGRTLLYMATGDYVPEDLDKIKGSRRLKRVIRKCCAFDPDNRFPSAEKVARELKRCLPGAGRENSGRQPVDHKMLKVLTGLVAALGGAVLLLLIQVVFLKKEIDSFVKKGEGSGVYQERQSASGEMESERLGKDKQIAEGWDISGYEKLLGQILDSIDRKEYRLMAEQCRELVSQLYADEFLTAIETEDTYYYEENDVRWEEYSIVRRGYEKMADDLAYHDRMLEKQMDNFEQYRFYIAALIKGNMEATREDENGDLIFTPIYSHLYFYKYEGNMKELDCSLECLLNAIIRGIELYQSEN